ncbi:Peptidase C48, SUMO/Sentrin/Ubl1 [Artemisia annua]|uniref:Peptidase C48, SUMO/Sentrin/Ubl1 n=1 Tax=Artemisia annua TaxID=35608 RepID=A0A2U1P6Y6_ARTAN|nr:Peptidase C48, SUMO/Sentrin/Ubl1 [Artemisia annua]
MDKLTDVNDQSKLVMVAAEALNELSNPQGADSVKNNEDLMDKVNRQRNPTVAMKSPFNIRKVNILCKLNKRENSVLELIKKKNASNLVDKFFGSDLYCNVDRSYFKNLVNKTKHVTSNIIDIWAVVLNEVEKFRSPGSVLRLFFTTQAMAPRREKSGVAIKKIQEEFLKAIKYGCERYLNCNDLSAVNLVFFPVCRQNHFYVYCFNLLNPSFIIIDNLKEGAGIYGNTTQVLFKLFCHYLKVTNHPKAQQISKCSPRRLEMEWQTSKNKTDCGIFTMRHLEFYSGVEDKQWRSIFKENGSKDELAKLRKVYAAKILLSDANKYKKDIVTEASKL